MKANEEGSKCLSDQGFQKCVADAMTSMDKEAMCACWQKAQVCSKASNACNPTVMLDEAERKKAVEFCVSTTECTAAQCEEMLNSASGLAVSMSAVALAVLASLRFI
jgi:hypothetical protein